MLFMAREKVDEKMFSEELDGGIVILFDQDRLVQLVQMHLQGTHLSKNLRPSADICDKL